MPWSSNATFLVDACHARRATSAQAIYKPHRGERPLWDFPTGLYRREVAAYELSEALGWELVPPTVLRDGTARRRARCSGSSTPTSSSTTSRCYEDEPHHDQLRRICRVRHRGQQHRPQGRPLPASTRDGHIWGIDNGLCFHAEFKLRTVIWEFGGEPIPPALRPDIERLTASSERGGLGMLDELLSDVEVDVMLARAQRLDRKPVYPPPRSDYAIPGRWSETLRCAAAGRAGVSADRHTPSPRR